MPHLRSAATSTNERGATLGCSGPVNSDWLLAGCHRWHGSGEISDTRRGVAACVQYGQCGQARRAREVTLYNHRTLHIARHRKTADEFCSENLPTRPYAGLYV